MSEPAELPDDPASWPADPFAVLGVPRGASETDAKRAYTRLIRRFKPEHHPEQFRRVRDAYEAVLQMLSWFRFDPEPAEPSVRPAADAPPGPEADRGEPPPGPRPFVDEADRLWRAAAEGDAAGAYAGLVELARVYPDRADVPLRLYWLLTLHPELDPVRTRHDWLAAALTRSRLAGAAAELYRREFAADPVRSLKTPYARLLAADAPAERVLTVARWRLDAAEWGQWQALEKDFVLLRDRLRTEDGTAWLQFVSGVHGHVAWEQQQPLYSRCRDELAAMRHLELRAPYVFDRVDEIEYLASRWRSAHDQYQLSWEVLDAVRSGWARAGEEWRKKLATACAAIAEEPTRILAQFDRVAGTENAAVLAMLARLLDECHAEAPPAAHYPPYVVRALVREFASRYPRYHYPVIRTALLEFLAAEALDPAEVAAACDDPSWGSLGRSIGSDGSLRCVWLALSRVGQ